MANRGGKFIIDKDGKETQVGWPTKPYVKQKPVSNPPEQSAEVKKKKSKPTSNED